MTRRRVGAVALAALLASGCFRGERRFEAEPVPESTTSTATSAPAPVVDVGPELEPDEVRGLPEEGIAVDTLLAEPARVVLVRLDGSVIGHVKGSLRGDRQAPGPLLLHDADRNLYLLDPDRRRVIREPAGHLERTPLAFGAHAVSDFERDPGQSWVERDGKVLLRLGNGMDSAKTVANDRDVVTSTFFTDADPPRVASHRALDLRTGKIRSLPVDCDAGDRHGDRWYLLCRGDSLPSTVEQLRGDTRAKLLSPIDDTGSWDAVAVSPDGTRMLAEWRRRGTPCNNTTVHLAAADGTGMVTPWGEAVADARGWTRDGRAVVLVHATSSCAPTAPEPGVYLVSPGGSPQRVYPVPANSSDFTDAAVWVPLLR